MLMQETLEKEPQLSQEEIEMNKQKLVEYYEKNIPFLKLQSEYEELITKIQESKTRRVIAQVQMAQIMMGSQQSEEESDEQEAPVRKLKREE
jgi:uncharacterized membrane-anchored protein YhcB (DUF1043 family)